MSPLVVVVLIVLVDLMGFTIVMPLLPRFAKHYSFDWTWRLDVDPAYAHMLAEGNEQHDLPAMTDVDGRPIAAHRALTMEMEWETDYLPERFRPRMNDRAWVMGRWIYDCGHPPFQTEIHPPQAVAFTRTQPHRFGNEAADGPANLTYMYVYGRGSSLEHTFDFFSIAQKDLPRFARNYEFDILLPPRPSPEKTIRQEVVELPYGGPAPIMTLSADQRRVHVVYPVSGALNAQPDGRMGAIIAVGWR